MSDASQFHTRRAFLQRTTACLTALAAAPSERLAAGETAEIAFVDVDPTPRFELSPHLYMQFMEPLGTNDSSVEASWDHVRDQWRPDLIEVTRSLAPGMVRWGGLFCSYYRWREGVGPRQARVPMHNIVWGGIESNQIGTAEFVDFCRQVGADPLMCVNLDSDGRPQFQQAKGSVRSGDAREAADWVAYCNQPDNAERRAHGIPAPLRIPYWQLGNETSYAREGFDLETAAQKTVEFARAMRESDPSIQLIGWGDSGWAPRMAEIAGEHLQYLAFHHMFNPDTPEEPTLAGEAYRRDPEATWQILMKAWQANDTKIRQVRESIRGRDLPLAMTECHFAIPGNNRNDVLRTWAGGVSYARILNNHQRHGDVLKIATAADFCGTRWTVNAVILGTHPTRVFLMPVALVMRQYRQYLGERAVTVTKAPHGLDVVASRTENRIYLNVVNTHRSRPVRIGINVHGTSVLAATGTMIADDPTTEVSSYNCRDVMRSRMIDLAAGHPIDLPAASVTSLALTIALL
jgi:alpha-L-arabinofuranosidase